MFGSRQYREYVNLKDVILRCNKLAACPSHDGLNVNIYKVIFQIKINLIYKVNKNWTSLEVKWLWHCTFTTEDVGSTPGLGKKIPHALHGPSCEKQNMGNKIKHFVFNINKIDSSPSLFSFLAILLFSSWMIMSYTCWLKHRCRLSTVYGVGSGYG